MGPTILGPTIPFGVPKHFQTPIIRSLERQRAKLHNIFANDIGRLPEVGSALTCYPESARMKPKDLARALALLREIHERALEAVINKPTRMPVTAAPPILPPINCTSVPTRIC